MDGVDVVVAACFRVVGYFTLYDTCLLIFKISSSRPDDMYSTLIFYFYFLLPSILPSRFNIQRVRFWHNQL